MNTGWRPIPISPQAPNNHLDFTWSLPTGHRGLFFVCWLHGFKGNLLQVSHFLLNAAEGAKLDAAPARAMPAYSLTVHE